MAETRPRIGIYAHRVPRVSSHHYCGLQASLSNIITLCQPLAAIQSTLHTCVTTCSKRPCMNSRQRPSKALCTTQEGTPNYRDPAPCFPREAARWGDHANERFDAAILLYGRRVALTQPPLAESSTLTSLVARCGSCGHFMLRMCRPTAAFFARTAFRRCPELHGFVCHELPAKTQFKFRRSGTVESFTVLPLVGFCCCFPMH